MSKKRSKFQETINFYLTVLVLFLFVVIPPILCGLLYLSQVPDITWAGEGNLTYRRIWMYRERRPLGLAYETRQVVEQYSQTEVCVQHNLRFLLWGQSKEAQPATSRQIMLFVDNRWQPTGEACR